MIDTVALVIGYCVLSLSSVAFLLLLTTAWMDYVFRKMNAHVEFSRFLIWRRKQRQAKTEGGAS